jgi:hypothetical protein
VDGSVDSVGMLAWENSSVLRWMGVVGVINGIRNAGGGDSGGVAATGYLVGVRMLGGRGFVELTLARV